MRLFYILADIIPAVVMLVPVTAVLGRIRHWNQKQTILRLLFCWYLTAVFSMVGLPNIRYHLFAPNLHLIPLVEIPSDLKNSLLNILMFLPLGWFLALLWGDRKRLPNALVFGFCLSLTIELLQIFSGRTTDVNDLFTNTLGILPGFFLARFFPNIPGTDPKEARMLVLLSFGLMFFLQPLAWYLYY